MKKIPPDAFDYYFSLGPGRSYRAVAEHFGVSKRAVTALAARESWQERLAQIEAKARERADQQMVDAFEESRSQRLKALRLVLGKGIESLREMRFDQPTDAARAITSAVREIRVELGEPSERTALTVEDTIRREYERWMAPVEDIEGGDVDCSDADADDAADNEKEAS